MRAAIDDDFTFVIYGLEKDGETVLGEVFAQKVATLVKALKAADRSINGGKRHVVLVEDLRKGSARVKFRERLASRKRTRGTGSAELGRAFSAVYQGGSKAAEVPATLLNYVYKLAAGADQTFSHAEAIYAEDKVIRVDKFFFSQVVSAEREMASVIDAESSHFVGRSRDAFDGELEVIDNRGQLVRAILTLTAGGRTIECLLNRNLLVDALAKFGTRVVVEGFAIYNDKDFLPQRIEVETIRKIKPEGDISTWRGKFNIPSDFDEEVWSDDLH